VVVVVSPLVLLFHVLYIVVQLERNTVLIPMLSISRLIPTVVLLNLGLLRVQIMARSCVMRCP
jgi:hypothetical protein